MFLIFLINAFSMVTSRYLTMYRSSQIKKKTLTQVFSCEFCEISTNTFSYRPPLGDCFCTYFMQRQVSCNKFITMMIHMIQFDSHWRQNGPSNFGVINVEDVGRNIGNKNGLCTVTKSFMFFRILFFSRLQESLSFICLSLVYSGFPLLISFQNGFHFN